MTQPLHWTVEALFDRWQLEQIQALQQGYIQCLGDSNTGQMLARKMAGRSIITSGFGSGTTTQVLERLGSVLNTDWPPQLVFLWLGTNSAVPDITQDVRDAFVAEYKLIVNAYTNAGSKVLIGSILPIEPNKSLSYLRSQDSVTMLNSDIVYRVIPECGLSLNSTLVNFNYDYLVNGDGKTGYTRDGIHPTPIEMINIFNKIEAAAAVAL